MTAAEAAVSDEAPVPPADAEAEAFARPKRGELWVFFHFLRWMIPYWRMAVLCILTSLLGVTISMLPPWLSKFLVDEAFPKRDWTLLWALLAGYVGMDIFYRISGTVNSILNYYIDVRVGLAMRVHFMRHLQRLSMTFIQKRPIGQHMYRAGADISAIMGMVTDILPALIRAIYEFFLILAFTSFLDWKVTVLVLLYAIPYTAFAHWVASVQRRVERDSRHRWERYDAGVREGVAGSMVIKSFARQHFEVTRYMHLYADAWRQSQKVHWLNIMRGHTVGAFLPWIKERLLYIWFIRMVIKGEITYGTVFPILSYMNRLTNPIQQVVDYVQQVRVALVPAERLLETLDVLPAITDKRGARRMPAVVGDVRLEDVSFGYEDGRPVLYDINFAARPGQKIALVGPSGAGKSSVLGLLLRLYDPSAGRVVVDDHDLRDVQMHSYQQQVGLVMQETYLFGGSVRDNLLFANATATEEEIIQACKIAEIHDWVVLQPHGYDQDLSEGTRLSLGQKQRLGLARALLRDPKLLLFDEPTSSLDSHTEHKVMETFARACQGRTAIWVSHRLNTVMDADEILVVESGRIVERGTHAQLLDTGGAYQRMWEVYLGERETEDDLVSAEGEGVKGEGVTR